MTFLMNPIEWYNEYYSIIKMWSLVNGDCSLQSQQNLLKHCSLKGGINHDKEKDDPYCFGLYRHFSHRSLRTDAYCTGRRKDL